MGAAVTSRERGNVWRVVPSTQSALCVCLRRYYAVKKIQSKKEMKVRKKGETKEVFFTDNTKSC